MASIILTFLKSAKKGALSVLILFGYLDNKLHAIVLHKLANFVT